MGKFPLKASSVMSYLKSKYHNLSTHADMYVWNEKGELKSIHKTADNEVGIDSHKLSRFYDVSRTCSQVYKCIEWVFWSGYDHLCCSKLLHGTESYIAEPSTNSVPGTRIP